MTKFTDDLIRCLETHEGRIDTLAKDFFYQEVDYWKDETPEAWTNMGVSFEFVAAFGGEGEGDNYWTVYKFTDDKTGEEVYLRFQGWYQSFNGAEFENIVVVTPKQKTVTVYE